jgi:hypothetical protein
MRPIATPTVLCAPLLVGVAVLPLLSATPACVKQRPAVPAITSRFVDRFDRSQLGSDWVATSDVWTIRDGAVQVSGARNHPLWLRRRLPRNARIEFDAWSSGADGDIKCEVYGDGHSYATEDSYTATSYVVIFGGWHNSLNVIARMYEHGSDRQARRATPVVPGQRYHWAIERRGNVLTWSVDGQAMLEYDDPAPLAGAEHEYFAFNNWMVPLGFDNLVITPL